MHKTFLHFCPYTLSPGRETQPISRMATERSTHTLGRFGTVHLARGETLVDRGSLFVAWVAWPVASEAAATAAVALLRQQEPAADHVMTAYRVVDSKKKVAKGYDDDGEARGGQRLLGCLTTEKVVNAAVIVARVWGGVNLGKARFDHIQERAKTLLRAVGHQAGEGIRHSWGEGQTLGGGGGSGGGGGGGSSCSSAGSASSSGGSGAMPGPAAAASATSAAASPARKRKRPAESAAAQQQDEAAARKEAMAAAAERRLSMLQQS